MTSLRSTSSLVQYLIHILRKELGKRIKEDHWVFIRLSRKFCSVLVETALINPFLGGDTHTSTSRNVVEAI